MKRRRGVCGRIPCAHRDKTVKRAVEACGTTPDVEAPGALRQPIEETLR
jgi:hypothetical protein